MINEVEQIIQPAARIFGRPKMYLACIRSTRCSAV